MRDPSNPIRKTSKTRAETISLSYDSKDDGGGSLRETIGCHLPLEPEFKILSDLSALQASVVFSPSLCVRSRVRDTNSVV